MAVRSKSMEKPRRVEAAEAHLFAPLPPTQLEVIAAAVRSVAAKAAEAAANPDGRAPFADDREAAEFAETTFFEALGRAEFGPKMVALAGVTHASPEEMARWRMAPTHHCQVKCLVAAPTKKRCLELLQALWPHITRGSLSGYWSETGNAVQLGIAKAAGGTGVWVAPLDNCMRANFVRVDT